MLLSALSLTRPPADVTIIGSAVLCWAIESEGKHENDSTNCFSLIIQQSLYASMASRSERLRGERGWERRERLYGI
jgi:hypothetical protein